MAPTANAPLSFDHLIGERRRLPQATFHIISALGRAILASFIVARADEATEVVLFAAAHKSVAFGKARRSAVMTNLTLIYAMLRYSVGVRREVAMGQDRSEITEQVVKFPPKQQSGNPADEAGQAVIAQIRKAAELANENCDRAMALAHKLAMQLRATEDRITQLEAEVVLFRDRATRAEGWLQTIHSEIEQKLIAPRSAFGTEQTLASSISNTEPSQPPQPKTPHVSS
jgi:hypothetical protein